MFSSDMECARCVSPYSDLNPKGVEKTYEVSRLVLMDWRRYRKGGEVPSLPAGPHSAVDQEVTVLDR